MIQISVRALTTFMECQRKYHYSYNVKLEKESSEYLMHLYDVLTQMKQHIYKKSSGEETILDLPALFSKVERGWFTLRQEYLQAVNTHKSQFIRYLEYETHLARKVLSYDTYFSVPVDQLNFNFTGKADLVVHKKGVEGEETEAIIFSLSEPTLSSAARKAENKPENSLELALLYLGLCSKYPSLKVSYYHLKSKDDHAEKLVPLFNHKPNKNIVTANFTELSALDTVIRHWDSIRDTTHLLRVAASDESMFAQNCSDKCTTCSYYNLCKVTGDHPTVVKISAHKFNKLHLNEKQQQAVTSINNHLRIIAPPGSGKTATLVARTKYILESGVPYKKLLLLSFSNKAVDELKSRVIDSTWLCGDDIAVYTFNSFCFKILRQYANILGGRTDPTKPMVLLKKGDRMRFIQDYLNSHDMSEYDVSFAYPLGEYGIICRIDDAVKYLIDGIIPNDIDSDFLSLSEKCATHIRSIMQERNMITYHDQISMTKQLLDQSPKIAETLGRQYSYIMVDEAQDTDDLQYEIIRKIGIYSNNVCICGDDDQTLYEFRNANVKNMLQFHHDFPNCIDVVLDKNYRSGKSIVNLSKAFINENNMRFEKNMAAASDHFGKIELCNGENLSELANYVFHQVYAGKALSDITIIARKKASLEKVAVVLRAAGIPYRFQVNKLADESGFVKLLTYLKCMYDKYCDSDVYLLQNCWKHRFTLPGANNVDGLKAILQEEHKCFFANEADFLSQLSYLNCILSIPSNVITAIRSIIEDDGIVDMRKLYQRLYDIVLYGEDIFIDDDNKYDAINLITAHSSKGKEYPVVIIPSIDEFMDESNVEVARRVLFVAITRAKDSLFMYNKETEKKSLLLEEISNHLQTIHYASVKATG